MYSFLNKTNFYVVLMIFSAMTYLSTSYGSELITHGDRFGGGEERFQGGNRQGGERREGQEGMQRGGNPYDRTPQGGGYSNYGQSYAHPQGAAGRGAAYEAGQSSGYNQAGQGGTQYVPVDTYQPQSQPQQTYPYTQQPY